MTIFKNNLITLGMAVIGFSAVFTISVMIFMNHLYYEINTMSLGNTASALMKAIGRDQLTEIFSANGHLSSDLQAAFLKPFNEDETYRLTLIDTSGHVLWDSHVHNRLVNHIDREEVIAALSGREGSSRRESISLGMRHIYYALPVYGAYNNVIGAFRLSLSIPEFGSRVSPVIVPFLIFVCIFIIAAFWAIIMYSRFLASSLGRLVNIAQSSARLLSGADSVKAIDHISPEFISLEKALRVMAEELNLRFEQAKSESSRLEAILNGMSEAVFAMDQNLRLHLVNPKARELFNLGSRDVTELSLLEATHSTELVETAVKAISCGSSLETDLTFHTGLTGFLMSENSGRQRDNPRVVRHFQVYASILTRSADSETSTQEVKSGYNNNFSAAQNCAGAVLVLQEITQLVKLERVRKDFVANVSHELRTPIQLIKGFSETLLDTANDLNDGNKEQIIHFLEIILKNAGIMENLTNDLLILANLENNSGINESSEINARMEDQSISLLIDEAVSSVQMQAKNKQIEIAVNCPQDLQAKLYGSFIIQALINLIDNGIKYSPAGSTVWVNAYKTGGDSGELCEIVFEVKDNGIGIPSGQLERIFERFYRVDRTTPGSGLGLSIVRHIALIHSGRAEAESRTGKGSSFYIIIPSNRSNYSNHKDHNTDNNHRQEFPAALQ